MSIFHELFVSICLCSFLPTAIISYLLQIQGNVNQVPTELGTHSFDGLTSYMHITSLYLSDHPELFLVGNEFHWFIIWRFMYIWQTLIHK
ncbi:hypothetical protein BDB01DRAFT_782093 [Pilobolus umbonatus]|nr:hypothetical protein BDB01DRAFT_782093 [Pilobolus umbonatus]